MSASKFLLLIFGGIFATSCGNCCDDPCKDYSIGYIRLLINFGDAQYINRKTTFQCASIPIAGGDLNGGVGNPFTTRLDPDKYNLTIRIKNACPSFSRDMKDQYPANQIQEDDFVNVLIVLNSTISGSEITIPYPTGAALLKVTYVEPCNKCDFSGVGYPCSSYRQSYSYQTETSVPKNTSINNALGVSIPLKYDNTFCSADCK